MLAGGHAHGGGSTRAVRQRLADQIADAASLP
jgi:hypothetical protein